MVDNSGIGFPPIRAFVGGGHRGLEAHREGAWRMHQLLTGRDAGEGYTAIIQQRPMHHAGTVNKQQPMILDLSQALAKDHAMSIGDSAAAANCLSLCLIE